MYLPRCAHPDLYLTQRFGFLHSIVFLNPTGLWTGHSEPEIYKACSLFLGLTARGSGRVLVGLVSAWGALDPSPRRLPCSQQHLISRARRAPCIAHASRTLCHIPGPTSDGSCSRQARFHEDSEAWGWQPSAWRHCRLKTFPDKYHPEVRGVGAPREPLADREGSQWVKARTSCPSDRHCGRHSALLGKSLWPQ